MMRAKTAASACCMVVALALLLAGCGGAGRSMTAQVTPASTFVSDQATVITLNMEWLPLLFPTAYRDNASGSPIVPDPVPQPDGSMIWTFTDSDGTVEVWIISADGLTQTGTITHPDGEVVHDTLNIDGATGNSVGVRTFPDGSRMNRTIVIAPNSPDPDHLYNSQTGTVTLASGRVLDFKMWQYGLHYVLQVDGHEGWVYNLTTPTLSSQELPDTSRAATGSLVRGGVPAVQFALDADTGAPQWKVVELTAPGSITGLYQLGETATGTGTVKQAGQILMTVQWGDTGKVTATAADGQNQVGQPSAAAQDFLVDRWLWALAESGPNPR